MRSTFADGGVDLPGSLKQSLQAGYLLLQVYRHVIGGCVIAGCVVAGNLDASRHF